MREIAFVQSSGLNELIAWVRIAREAPGEWGRQGHSALGVDDSVRASTRVIQSKDRVSGNRLAKG